MTTPSLAEVQTKLCERISTDAAILALVPVESIRNHLPQDAPLPYIRFRVDKAPPWDTKTSNGYTVHAVFDTWTDKHGDLFLMEAHDAIYKSLQRIPLALSAGQNIIAKYDGFNTTVESDGQTHHGISSFVFTVSN